jgi:hypothetical protein
MAKEKIRKLLAVVVEFYALLCAPTYKNKGFYSDPPHPESSKPTKKRCRQKRIPTPTYVGSDTKKEVTYYSKISSMVRLGDVNGNTTIVGYCR